MVDETRGIKRPRKGARPEELLVGTGVLYHGNTRGIVREAYAPMDEFWVVDEQSDEYVRDELGSVEKFQSSDLQLLSDALLESVSGPAAAAASVLILGVENHIQEALRLFGSPDERQRCDTQMLLGFPTKSCRCAKHCGRFNPWSRSMCDESSCPLIKIASEGLDESIFQLAQRLRPDLDISVRPYYLKQALDQLGPDVQRLTGYYCLSAVTLPYSKEDIESTSGLARCLYEQLFCQIDLGTSGLSSQEVEDRSLMDTARRALEMTSGIRLADDLWAEGQQKAIRKKLGVEDLPVNYWNDNRKAYVIILPEDAFMWTDNGILCFKAAGRGAFAVPGANRDGAKTTTDWLKEQDQFKHLPPLKPGWIRCKSKKGDMYFFNPKTKESTFNFNEAKLVLPPGWTREVSKSTGKVYYFNARLRKSMFEIPTE